MVPSTPASGLGRSGPRRERSRGGSVVRGRAAGIAWLCPLADPTAGFRSGSPFLRRAAAAAPFKWRTGLDWPSPRNALFGVNFELRRASGRGRGRPHQAAHCLRSVCSRSARRGLLEITTKSKPTRRTPRRVRATRAYVLASPAREAYLVRLTVGRRAYLAAPRVDTPFLPGRVGLLRRATPRASKLALFWNT